MNFLFQLALTLAIALITGVTVFANTTPTSPQVKYRAQDTVNFEELLIQGQLKRPEVSVVTGNTQQGADGLLRLRENFLDRIATDAGEEP